MLMPTRDRLVSILGDPGLECRGRDGAAQVISLANIAAHAREGFHRILVLNSLSHGRAAQVVREVNHRAHDNLVVLVAHEVLYKGLIDPFGNPLDFIQHSEKG